MKFWIELLDPETMKRILQDGPYDSLADASDARDDIDSEQTTVRKISIGDDLGIT